MSLSLALKKIETKSSTEELHRLCNNELYKKIYMTSV